MTISAFEIAISEEDVADLRQRLGHTRWPDPAPGGAWAQGTELGFLRELVHRWGTSYDWRAHERELNEVPNYIAELHGKRVHFVHHRGRGPRPIPLLLAHGCYSNYYEFHKVAHALAEPQAHGGDARDAFDVTVWSLPGFGFSDRPTEPGCNIAAMAEIAHHLMTSELGYPVFGVVGGSWGGLVASCLAFTRPESLSGIFLTQATPPAAPVVAPGEPQLTAAERVFAAGLQAHRGPETGYAEILRTRPQSLAYALNDSPAGLAGWIVEKLRAWSDCGGDLGSTFSLDEILTSISITWFTSTAASGHRLYYENARGDWAPHTGQRAAVPTGVLAMPDGIPHERVPPETVRRWFDLRYYRRAERGGHYPAMETPEIFVEAVRDFFRPLRSPTVAGAPSGQEESEQ
jgi:pimeloyl-ACP methyl ester carboxylesterase